MKGCEGMHPFVSTILDFDQMYIFPNVFLTYLLQKSIRFALSVNLN